YGAYKRYFIVLFMAGPVQADQYARKGRADVVRNGIGHIAYSVHQGLDPIQHAIDIAAQLLKFVSLRRNRDTTGQLACTHMNGGFPNGLDALAQRATK